MVGELSELLIEKLKNSVGKDVLVFSKNGFRNNGRILGCDGLFLELFDYRTQAEKFIELNQVSEVNFR